MTLPMDITEPQTNRIRKLCDLLSCQESDVRVIQHAPDLPPQWIEVTIGIEKGRPKTIALDPEGGTGH